MNSPGGVEKEGVTTPKTETGETLLSGKDRWLVYPTVPKCRRTVCRGAAKVMGGYCTPCFKRIMSEPFPRPEVIVLCGSTRFMDAFDEANRRFTLNGRIVLTVGVDTKTQAADLSPATKRRLDDLHKRKIDIADLVYVLNVGGYIGESTRSEIEYAEWYEKPIEYLER